MEKELVDVESPPAAARTPGFASVVVCLALTANVLIHAASFLPGVAVSFFSLTPFFLLTLISFLIAGSLIQFYSPTSPSLRTGNLVDDWRLLRREQWDFGLAAHSLIPGRQRVVLLLAFLYAAACAGVQFYRFEGRRLEADEHGYFLVSGGDTIRALTLLEYRALRLLKHRTWSAFLILVSLYAAIMALVVFPKIADEVRRESQKRVRDAL